MSDDHSGSRDALMDVLSLTLDLAVPLRIQELSRLAPEHRNIVCRRWAAEAAAVVAHRGDTLQFGGKRGEAAEVFNALAKGLAAGAFALGGIDFAGRHWSGAGEEATPDA